MVAVGSAERGLGGWDSPVPPMAAPWGTLARITELTAEGSFAVRGRVRPDLVEADLSPLTLRLLGSTLRNGLQRLFEFH